jgi:SAM-dependent methyltransferase
MPTDYNTIAEDFRKASEHPIKQYIESYSFLQQLGDVRGKSVLDLACGEGHYTRLVKQQGATYVIGLDISKAMIDQAQATEAATPLGIEYRMEDATKLGRIGAFNVVTAVYLFPYATTEQTLIAMFQSIFKNLLPDGKLVAITLNPNLRAEDAMIYPPYGIQMTVAGVIQDGDQIGFTIEIPHTRGNSFDLQVTFWGQKVLEHAARAAGFQQTEWQSLQMSQQGLEKFPPHHWQAFLKKPYSILLVCTK